MRRLLFLISALVALSAGPAHTATVTLSPTADTGLPFWCDWGYDWDERCYWDDGIRLPVGGVDDKVWRSALRFDLASVPQNAAVTSARLRLFHDGTCVAPYRTATECDERTYEIDAHRIWTARWASEQEVEIDGRIAATAWLDPATEADALDWNLTALVRVWHAGSANNGVLLKLADGEEDFGTSGPYFPSSSYPQAALRPRLVVTFTTRPPAL